MDVLNVKDESKDRTGCAMIPNKSEMKIEELSVVQEELIIIYSAITVLRLTIRIYKKNSTNCNQPANQPTNKLAKLPFLFGLMLFLLH